MTFTRRHFGILLLLALSTITILLWIFSYDSYDIFDEQPLRYLTQILANLTVVYMAISLLLSMRVHFIDKIFRGLDKSYKIHALVGSIAFLLMIAHPLLLVANALPDLNRASYYLIPRDRLAANLGLAAVYTAIFAFTFMTFLKIPYNAWLNTHRLLAISFLLGSIHGFLAPSYLFRSLPLTIWIASWIVVGLIAAVYSIIFYRLFGKKFSYSVAAIDKNADIINISLKPNQESISYLPGQYVYIRFLNSKLGSELHPFSPSTATAESTLRLSIKPLGDYTHKLVNELHINDKADVFGPFGAFSTEYIAGKSDMIWIGGGIGITPFLSMLHEEAIHHLNKKILFYYSVNKPEEAVFDQEIKKIAPMTPNIIYQKWVADIQGFLTMDKIIAEADKNQLSQPTMLLCGPPPMMNALTTQAAKLNIPKERIIFEQFSFLP